MLLHDRVFNFSAGPSTLPVEVLEQAREELLNFRGTGMSVMEMSHRTPPFETILAEAEADLRTLLAIPSNYRVLFLQGGASLQFTMVPMNLAHLGEGGYTITGSWGQKAFEAAGVTHAVKVLYDGESEGFRDYPDTISSERSVGYVHTTSNETIQGVQFPNEPAVQGILACDMSSDILSRPVDVERYGLIYAGAQKNMGPAGLTVVIVRDDLLERTPSGLPPMLDYKVHAKNGSMYNTPPTFAIYLTGLVLKRLLATGGLTAAKERNEAKAAAIYGAIDGSGGFYRGHAAARARSRMNVTFTLENEDRTKAFLKEAQAHRMDGLKGHRSVGGCRASIYNAFPLEGALALAEFMADFARRNG